MGGGSALEEAILRSSQESHSFETARDTVATAARKVTERDLALAAERCARDHLYAQAYGLLAFVYTEAVLSHEGIRNTCEALKRSENQEIAYLAHYTSCATTGDKDSLLAIAQRLYDEEQIMLIPEWQGRPLHEVAEHHLIRLIDNDHMLDLLSELALEHNVHTRPRTMGDKIIAWILQWRDSLQFDPATKVFRRS